MMENRAFEDEAKKSSYHPHLHHQLQQQQYRQQRPQSYHQQQQNHNRPYAEPLPPTPQQNFPPDPPNVVDQTQQQHPRHHHHHHHNNNNRSHHHHHHQQQVNRPRFDNPYRGPDSHNPSDCHVYEDIVTPYGVSCDSSDGYNAFQRNLTLPLRRTSQSCESIDAVSSSVRVTNKERGSVIERINRTGEREHHSRHGSITSSNSSGTEHRPARRRRKKDCRHCKVKSVPRGIGEAGEQDAAYEERSAELRAIFGLQPADLCRLAPQLGCLNAPVVYAIGCNGTDCNGSAARSSDEFAPTTPSTATMPRFVAHAQEGSFADDKTAPSTAASPGSNNNNNNNNSSGNNNRAAGMKVNSIYAQEHWHTSAQSKDPRIFLNDPKEQSCNSPFQRAYAAVSANSPNSDNRANLRRSARDEPAPHPARLRKHLRHGWTLHFGRPLSGATCTKSLALLLIVVLALLGIGGIALYIVFEPEKLHVIQQYLRSNGRNSTSLANSSFAGPELLTDEFSSSTPLTSSTLLDVILNSSSVSSINSNNVPGGGGGVDENEPIFVTAWAATTTARSTPTMLVGTINTFRTSTTSSPPSTLTSTFPTPTTTTTSRGSDTLTAFQETHLNHKRPCGECYGDEVCVARNADETPYCRPSANLADSSGCGGLCGKNQACHKIEVGAYRCTEMEHHCLEDEWTCRNIFCIPLVKRCDGQMNCYDHSDEYDCECNLETHFHCGNQTSCLPLSKKCDGHVDCFNASDEENCTASHELGRLCPENEYACKNKQCIRRQRFCDGYRDCADGTDEPQGCRGKCNKHEFTCLNHRCINKADKCNGIDDCGDRSDEQHCRERS